MYRIFIFLYLSVLRLATLWNPKARLWVQGRRYWSENLGQRLAEERRSLVWFHCASLGEFEQGRPLMEQWRRRYPDMCILLTFFSPSGFEACKQYAGADHIVYLPMDSPANAKRFLDLANPALAIFIKYEFWHYYLEALHARQTPTLLVSAVFRENQPFFRWYGRFWKNMLRTYTMIFVQDKLSLDLLEGLGLGEKVQLSGDTRFDRVLEITEDKTGKEIPAAAAFASGAPVIVAGSTWPEDEKELAHFVRTHPSVRFILAPHEVGKDHLRDLMQRFPDHVLYSEYVKTPVPAQCLLIDNIGLLSRLYQYAAITYVGGGFGGDGVHNVLEAAVWGKPVVFGPVFDKYREARELIEAGGGASADSTLTLEACFNRLLTDKDALADAGRSARAYVEEKTGATKRILGYIETSLRLPSSRKAPFDQLVE